MLNENQMSTIEEFYREMQEEVDYICNDCQVGNFHTEMFGEDVYYVECPTCGHLPQDNNEEGEEAYELFGHLSLVDEI